jgi:hypothetical protein
MCYLADLTFWQGSGFEYQPGDTVGVIPQNPVDEVQKIFKHLKISERADTVITVSVKPGIVKRKACVPPYIPTKATLRHILQTCLDIRAIPKKVTALYVTVLYIMYCQPCSLCVDKNQMRIPRNVYGCSSNDSTASVHYCYAYSHYLCTLKLVMSKFNSSVPHEDQIKENELGGTCGMRKRGEESVQGFGGKARRKETTWKTKA